MSNVGQIPQLRFPEFTGEWQEKRLGEIGKFYRGLSYDKSNVRSFGNLVLRSGNIQGGQLILDQDLQFVDKAIGKQQNLRKGDIVICMANGSKKLVGKAAIYKGQYSGSITVGAFCSIFRSNNTLAEYLLQTHQYKKYLNMLLAGTNINNLKNSDLEKLKFILPSSEEEQQKIAAFLAAVDKRVALLERKVQQLEAYKRGVMQQLFSQQLRFTRPDGSHFPAWQEKRLGEVFDYQQPTSYIVRSTEYKDTYKTPVLTAGKTFILGYTNETEGVYTNLPATLFDDFTTAVQWVDFPFKVKSSAVKILKTKAEYNPKIAHELLSRVQFKAENHQRHWISIHQNLSVYMPSLPEQQKIAAFLSALDEKISLTRQQLDKTKQFKKGLLQRMFV